MSIFNKKMLPIDWHIYRLLEEKTLGTKDSVSQREIYESCLAAGFKVKWDESQNHHNDHCRWLANSLMRINSSPEVDKTVGHHCWRYRIYSEEEAAALVIAFNKREQKARARKVAILEKMRQNGQGKLLSNQLNEIGEDSKAKLFHESFNEADSDQ